MWIQHLNGISTFTLFNFTDLINFSRQTQFWRIKYPFRAAFEDVSKQDLGHHCQTYREKDRCCSPRSCYCAVMRCTAGWAYICMLYVTVWLSMQSVGESRTPAHCLCARKSTWCIKLLLSPLLLHRQLCLLLQHIFLMKILRFNFFYQALALTTGTVAFDARQLRTKSISNISCPLIHSPATLHGSEASCGSDNFAELTFPPTTEMIVIFWHHKIWRPRCGRQGNLAT